MKITKTLGALAIAGAMATPALAADKKPEGRSLEWGVGFYGAQDIRSSGVENWFVGAKGAVVNIGTQLAGDGSHKYGSLHLEAQLYKSQYSVADQFENGRWEDDAKWERVGDKYVHENNFYSRNDWMEATNLEDGLKVGPRFGLVYRSPRNRFGISGEVGAVVGKFSFGERRLITQYIIWDKDCPVTCYGSPLKAGDTTALVQQYDEWDAKPPKSAGYETTVFAGINLNLEKWLGASLRLGNTLGSDPRFRSGGWDASVAFTVGRP